MLTKELNSWKYELHADNVWIHEWNLLPIWTMRATTTCFVWESGVLWAVFDTLFFEAIYIYRARKRKADFSLIANAKIDVKWKASCMTSAYWKDVVGYIYVNMLYRNILGIINRANQEESNNKPAQLARSALLVLEHCQQLVKLLRCTTWNVVIYDNIWNYRSTVTTYILHVYTIGFQAMLTEEKGSLPVREIRSMRPIGVL